MDYLIFIYLILFPFGKLLGLLPDLIILLIAIVGRKLKWNNFFTVVTFSLLFSTIFFPLGNIAIGVLYAIRFFSYVLFSKIIYEKYGKDEKSRKLIFNSLIVVGVSVAVFGWIQYLVFPDLTALKTLGWDDHYYRLVSTFLDPAFTGIILVLTEILVLVKTAQKKTTLLICINIFLVLTIAFTYSRASYLSLVLSIIMLIWRFRKKFLVFLLVFFILIIPALPRPAGEGVNLVRTYSINEKFKNYKDSIILFSKSPVFGIGFDNVCAARQKFLNDKNTNSHSCSGLDNSLFFVLVTTGIVGMFVFAKFIYVVIASTAKNDFGFALKLSFFSVLIHGMFTNTFFYSFVLGWMAIFIGISRRAKSNL